MCMKESTGIWGWDGEEGWTELDKDRDGDEDRAKACVSARESGAADRRLERGRRERLSASVRSFHQGF